VRILFAFAGGRGHAEPLVPLARAAEVAGHTVAFTGRRSAAEELGFALFPTGTEKPPKRKPLREVDPKREEREFLEGFVGRARERMAAVLALCREWQPDLVVCSETDFGAMIAAERLGLPHATVLVLATGAFVRAELVAEGLSALRAEEGLPSDPELEMPRRHLVLSPFPPSFRESAFPVETFSNDAPPPAPPWLERLAGPIVYFTLGTVFNLESGDLFTRVLVGLRELPVGIVATVGRGIDPEELGPQPENVHVEQYVSQSVVLPRCSAVVSHGGSGSLLGALAHGLPSVLLPMGADQPLNAARGEALGVARVLDVVRAAPEDVRDAVAAVLAEPGYRSAAERMRDELAAFPGPAHAMTLLEALAAY
jgi:UDP:flavonoid glycosyltransferase YjiC (YdhE family)